MSGFQSLLYQYDLEGLIHIILSHKFCNVCLQFIDEYLSDSLDIYLYVRSKVPEDVELYIVADSTWGTSVDDISASHVSADLLVYFGMDLSSSSSIPTVVVVRSKPLNFEPICNEVQSTISSAISPAFKNFLILYEPCYYYAAIRLWFSLSSIVSTCSLAQLPNCADLQNWQPVVPASEKISLGGLLVPSEFNCNDKESSMLIYVGNYFQQLQRISFQCSQLSILQYNTDHHQINLVKGTQSFGLMERYGATEKVKKAKIVGLLIGSMGYEATLTNAIIHRLEQLILTAGKSFYTFVMGRINEAKLCNFPEIDIFCLIANEDIAIIKPKTFPVAIITPYELELGLGAREWNSTIITDIREILKDDLEVAIERVQEAKELNEYYDPTSDLAESEIHLLSLESSSSRESEQQLIVFESAASEYFKQRKYQGLQEFADEQESTTIHVGQVGIAAKYDSIGSKPLSDIEDIIQA